MNSTTRVIIIAALAGAIGAVVALKQPGSPAAARNRAASSPASPDTLGMAPATTSAPARLPRLLDLGADKCIPCKLMAPILVEMRKEYAGQLDVEFIDVWKNPGIGEQYKLGSIPTQIFFDETGEELFRHEGFFSKEDILSKWRALGFAFTPASAPH